MMGKTFFDLSESAQEYIKDRFSRYHISGEEAFESLFSDETRELNSEQIIEFLKLKDISHKMPQSDFPEFEDDLWNVFLEDSGINRSRGAENVTETEFELAWEDQIADVEFIKADESTLDILLDGLKDIDNAFPIEDILGGSFCVGIVLTGIETYRKIKNKEIELSEAPNFFAIKVGGKTVRYAIIGSALASSSPIIVSAGVGYLIYKNKLLIGKSFGVVYSFFTHEKTIEYSDLFIRKTFEGITATGNHTYRIITSDTTKDIINSTKAYSVELTKNVGNKAQEFANHDTTKKIVSDSSSLAKEVLTGATKIPGKVISNFSNLLNRKK